MLTMKLNLLKLKRSLSLHPRRIDEPAGDLKLVARAILPPEIMEGIKLKYEMFEYSIQ